MPPCASTFIKVIVPTSYNVEKRFRFQAKLQSDEVASPHMERFFLVGRVLLMYRIVKLKNFLVNWTEQKTR